MGPWVFPPAGLAHVFSIARPRPRTGGSRSAFHLLDGILPTLSHIRLLSRRGPITVGGGVLQVSRSRLGSYRRFFPLGNLYLRLHLTCLVIHSVFSLRRAPRYVWEACLPQAASFHFVGGRYSRPQPWPRRLQLHPLLVLGGPGSAGWWSCGGR